MTESSRRKQIINFKAEINEIEKTLARLIKKKKTKDSNQ